jgi:hypothetical protein
MSERELMTAEEIHEFGIEIVSNELKKDGYEILTTNNSIEVNPQITARKGSQLAFIVVRTACYPDKGTIEEATHFQMIDHADEFDAIPFFASVGLANAEATTEEEGFYAAYEGLTIMSRSDRAHIWNGEKPANATAAGLRQ